MISLLVSSCLSIGNKFPSKLNWIKTGKTQKQDVSLVLGSPMTIGSANGTPTWTYSYYQYRLWKKPHFKELRFYWDKDSKVKYYSFNSSFPRDINRERIIRKRRKSQR
tara:strand:- start:92 stop:415 length:324 start_codon:yes stop_codon:yes gene_type:complete